MSVYSYESPEVSAIRFAAEGVICQSLVTMAFGTDENTSGSFVDENIVDGGSF